MTIPIPPNTQAADFHIGWICIMEKEFWAALDVLDERWAPDDKSFLPPSGYAYGLIGGHKVVINVPHTVKGGFVHASNITFQMKHKFPCIRFVLLVGIGGGAPLNDDIRLGDVVFGEFIIPYKRGKERDDHFEIDPVRLKPPEELSTAVSSLRAEYDDEDLSKCIVDEVDSENRRKESYRRPAEDHLLDSTALHQDRACECLHGLTTSPSLIRREARPSTDHIKTHRGIVGSADQVLRSAKERDRLSRERNIVCFEMEAAAVMELTNGITIRGIADYADGHKNDNWHSYAALAAAVCAKKLLTVLRPGIVHQTETRVGDKEFVVRFQGVSDRINTNLGSKGRNARDAFNKTREAIDLHEEQIKLFTAFTKSCEDEDIDPKMLELLESFKEILQQELETLQVQVKRQRKENKGSEYVTREEWNSLKKRVGERRKEVNHATQGLRKVADLLGIAREHTENKHLGFAKEYVIWAGEVIEWLLALKRNYDHQGESSTPRKPLKWDAWRKLLPGKRQDQPVPESISRSPGTPSSEVIADRTPAAPSPETARLSPDIPADGRTQDKRQDESDPETPSPLLGTPPNQPESVDPSDDVVQSGGVPIPPTHSPPPIPSNIPSTKRRRTPPPPPSQQTASPGGARRPLPSPRPSAHHTSIGGSSSSNPRTESRSSEDHRASQETSEGLDDFCSLSVKEKRKIFQGVDNRAR